MDNAKYTFLDSEDMDKLFEQNHKMADCISTMDEMLNLFKDFALIMDWKAYGGADSTEPQDNQFCIVEFDSDPGMVKYTLATYSFEQKAFFDIRTGDPVKGVYAWQPVYTGGSLKAFVKRNKTM